MKNLHQLMGKTASQHQNGSIKFKHNNINPKCKWTKCTNQKTQTGKLDKKPKPSSVLYPGTHLTCKDTQRLKIKGWRKIYQANGEKKKQKLQFSSLIKIDFKATKIKRDKEGHYIMVKDQYNKKS